MRRTRLLALCLVGALGAACGGESPSPPPSSPHSTVSLPAGTYRSNVTADEARARGLRGDILEEVIGRYTLVVREGTFTLTQVGFRGDTTHLRGSIRAPADGRVVLTFAEGTGSDTLAWRLEGTAIRFHVVSFTGGASSFSIERAVWDSNPWVRAAG